MASTNSWTSWSCFRRVSGTRKYDSSRRWRAAPRFLEAWRRDADKVFISELLYRHHDTKYFVSANTSLVSHIFARALCCSVSTQLANRSSETDTEFCLASSWYLRVSAVTFKFALFLIPQALFLHSFNIGFSYHLSVAFAARIRLAENLYRIMWLCRNSVWMLRNHRTKYGRE